MTATLRDIMNQIHGNGWERTDQAVTKTPMEDLIDVWGEVATTERNVMGFAEQFGLLLNAAQHRLRSDETKDRYSMVVRYMMSTIRPSEHITAMMIIMACEVLLERRFTMDGTNYLRGRLRQYKDAIESTMTDAELDFCVLKRHDARDIVKLMLDLEGRAKVTYIDRNKIYVL